MSVCSFVSCVSASSASSASSFSSASSSVSCGGAGCFGFCDRNPLNNSWSVAPSCFDCLKCSAPSCGCPRRCVSCAGVWCDYCGNNKDILPSSPCGCREEKKKESFAPCVGCLLAGSVNSCDGLPLDGGLCRFALQIKERDDKERHENFIYNQHEEELHEEYIKKLSDIIIFNPSPSHKFKLKDLEEGETEILRNGEKTYKKKIKSNITNKYFGGDSISNRSYNLFVCGKMNFNGFKIIQRRDKDKYFLGNGCYTFRLKKEFDEVAPLVLRLLNSKNFLNCLWLNRRGSCQKYFNKEDFYSTLETVFYRKINFCEMKRDEIERVKKIRELEKEKKKIEDDLKNEYEKINSSSFLSSYVVF